MFEYAVIPFVRLSANGDATIDNPRSGIMSRAPRPPTKSTTPCSQYAGTTEYSSDVDPHPPTYCCVYIYRTYTYLSPYNKRFAVVCRSIVLHTRTLHHSYSYSEIPHPPHPPRPHHTHHTQQSTCRNHGILERRIDTHTRITRLPIHTSFHNDKSSWLGAAVCCMYAPQQSSRSIVHWETIIIVNRTKYC